MVNSTSERSQTNFKICFGAVSSQNSIFASLERFPSVEKKSANAIYHEPHIWAANQIMDSLVWGFAFVFCKTDFVHSTDKNEEVIVAGRDPFVSHSTPLSLQRAARCFHLNPSFAGKFIVTCSHLKMNIALLMNNTASLFSGNYWLLRLFLPPDPSSRRYKKKDLIDVCRNRENWSEDFSLAR